jgi:hypothetical protein
MELKPTFLAIDIFGPGRMATLHALIHSFLLIKVPSAIKEVLNS